MPSQTPLLELSNVSKVFADHEPPLQILAEVNFTLRAGETVALMGASGAGKTTLLQLMGCMDTPTSGTIQVGSACFRYSNASRSRYSRQRDSLRKNKMGFVYQYHYLLPELTALENVMLPRLVLGGVKLEAEKDARALLGELGLEGRLQHTLHKLSGGEQQRVAIARALINAPDILLADEPTGNLDNETAQHVLHLLLRLVREKNVAMVVATHNPDLARQLDRTEVLSQGRLLSQHTE